MKRILIAVLFISMPALAARYGDAGCGLGNLVFQKKYQILAATTNSTAGNQMFGISSGTFNCVEGNPVALKEMPEFIDANRVALANDIARGGGESIESLSKVMGCTETDQLATRLQKKYTDIFPAEATDPESVTESILSVVREDEFLAENCERVTLARK